MASTENKGSSMAFTRRRCPRLQLKALVRLALLLSLTVELKPSQAFGLDLRKHTSLKKPPKSTGQHTIFPPNKTIQDTPLFQTEKEIDSQSTWSSSSLANYYLLWSPNFPLKMALCSVSIWIIRRVSLALQWKVSHSSLLFQSHAIWFNGILPTLSSACCWIQLLLNMVSAAGCAGFNTMLGPLRPFFLSVLGYLTISTRVETPISTILLRWTIALLPEMLHIWNMRVNRQTTNKRLNTSTATFSLDPTTAAVTTTHRVSVDLDIPTMGCVACINKVDSSLRHVLSGNSMVVEVHDAQSRLAEGDSKGGKARVVFNVKVGNSHDAGNDVNPAILSSLVASVENAGFPCRVENAQSEKIS